jgi:translation initiation factor IF-3
VNERIRAREIRVIGSDGAQLGIMHPAEALERARAEGLDLVEVAAGSNPPVCRIMDYGRFKYEQKKSSKSKGHATALKEVKLRPRTDIHDLEFKLRNARRFLIEGNKVKVTVMFRGREIVHTALGRQQLDHVVKLLSALAKVESSPKMEGRFMSMILVPDRDGVAEAKRLEAEARKAEQEAGGEAENAEEKEPEREAEAEPAEA